MVPFFTFELAASVDRGNVKLVATPVWRPSAGASGVLPVVVPKVKAGLDGLQRPCTSHVSYWSRVGYGERDETKGAVALFIIPSPH